MKQFYLLAAVAGMTLASCVKNEVTPDLTNESNAITYQAVTGKASSRAMIENATYPTGETFGAFAYFLPEGSNWATNKASAGLYIPESEISYYPAAQSPFEENTWHASTVYYWPKQGTLTFLAYSPYSMNADADCNTTDGITFTDWDVDAKQDVDVMVADIQADKGKTDFTSVNNAVSTVFKHKLSQIVDFKIKTDIDYANTHTTNGYVAGDKTFTLMGIYINKVAHKGTYVQLPTEAWAPVTTSTKDYTWYADVTGTPFNATEKSISKTPNYLLVLPQTFMDNTTDATQVSHIKIVYKIKTYTDAIGGSSEETVTSYATLYSIHDTARAWAMNKKITYTITISLKDDIIYWNPSVEDWETDEGSITI